MIYNLLYIRNNNNSGFEKIINNVKKKVDIIGYYRIFIDIPLELQQHLI